MTIRRRVTLWYTAVLLISFLLAGGGMYYELVIERERTQKSRLTAEPMSEEVGEVLLLYVLPALIVTVLGGWWLLRRSLAPLDHLTVAAERMSAENIKEALPRTFNGDEVDRLSEVLNGMNQRLWSAMSEIHEFTLHASHELKTPLSILHGEIETALEKPGLTNTERESLGSQLDEIQRLTRIVEGLALLARSRSGQMKYAQAPVPLHEIVQEMAEDTLILGRAKRLKVEVGPIDEGWIRGDRDRLRQLFLNLIENATKYNKQNGTISIAHRGSPTSFTVEIANTGDGVSRKDLPHLFEKFYRGASARSGDDPGGIGLGLSIAEAIAQAHQGSIQVDTAKPGWTRVSVSFSKTGAPDVENSDPKLSGAQFRASEMTKSSFGNK